jgi:protein SCO1
MKRALGLLLLFSLSAAAQNRAFTVPDVEVKTQSGETRRFYTDLVKDRVVAINFVFTSCTTICPTMGATFARVQKLLAERGSNAVLISVSIDPQTDTPERLAQWSARLGGRAGWTLVTGNSEDIESILKAVGAFTADPASHAPVVLVGNEAEGKWERVDGLASPTPIVEAIARVEGKRK